MTKKIYEILGINSEIWNLLPAEIKNENIVKDLTEKNKTIENLKNTRQFLIKKGLELSSEKIELEKRVEDLKNRKGLSDFYKSIGDILKRLRKFYYEYNQITVFGHHPDFSSDSGSILLRRKIMEWEDRMREVLSDWENAIENHEELMEENELFVCKEERELFIYQYQYNSDWQSSYAIKSWNYVELFKEKEEVEKKLNYEKNERDKHENSVKNILLAQNKKKRERVEELEKKLEEEREIHTDTMKTMDKWYLQRNQELTKENEQKDQKIKELEQQLESLKLEANTQISPIQTWKS